jgi:hypothetical protein
MLKVFVPSLVFLACGSAFCQDIVTDSLVKNLDCSTLSKDTVLASLQPDAFSSEREIPITNWGDILFPLGQCWGLSHAQRALFYLGRFETNSELTSDAEMSQVLKIFKGGALDSVFPVSETFFPQLESSETFKESIQDYEATRVFNFSNLDLMGIRDRGKSDNAATFAAIQAEISKNRLPIISMRINPLLQHVVVIKKIVEDGAGAYHLAVYNPNLPNRENEVIFSDNEFYAPQIIDVWDKLTPNRPVGVFIVDEGDMDQIQSTLLNYYSEQCRR